MNNKSSSSIDGKYQSSFPPLTRSSEYFAAFCVAVSLGRAATIASELVSPVPIFVKLAPQLLAQPVAAHEVVASAEDGATSR